MPTMACLILITTWMTWFAQTKCARFYENGTYVYICRM